MASPTEEEHRAAVEAQQQQERPLTEEEHQIRINIGEENWRKLQQINEEAKRKTEAAAATASSSGATNAEQQQEQQPKKVRKGKKPGPKKGWKKNNNNKSGVVSVTMQNNNKTGPQAVQATKLDKTWLALGELWNIAFNVEEAATGLAKVSATIFNHLEENRRQISEKERRALKVVNDSILSLIETRRQLYDLIPQGEYEDWIKETAAK